ncbi:MAG: chemotaxis protein CheD [Candidatus Magnetoglobus multicellularis str. Araruama]|uniref:Probable chemoreceptor glutamine deamidase CheD n=1 Tax=Candidatus Magnetoglobus multicellularis str. Araruama TaxID=890399 RepID=A0A1V1PH13_9BACT|nr:MAG: chemotaxis protein CheD [Candidatus Magnetoglobus multicellularis str. Araruama]
MVITVGVGDLKISNNPKDVIITHALGSCIGITVYDPETQVGGLLHYMLPESTLDRAKAKKAPFMFADTGIPILFRSCYKLGAVKSRMIVKVAGGSAIMDDSGFFNIGKRNYASLRKILWRNNVLIQSEDVGGKGNRTMRLYISNGTVEIKESNKKYRPI